MRSLTPILLCALAVILPARLGLITVGGEGQLYFGALTGTLSYDANDVFQCREAFGRLEDAVFEKSAHTGISGGFANRVFRCPSGD